MTRLLAVTLCLGALVANATSARSDDTDFYAGKNITVMIGYAAGGTYDATARLLSRHMGRHIPGNPTFLPQNLPGSGGIKAILNLYSVAPRDGTALGMLARSYAIEPAFNPQLAKYDPARFLPIGSTSKEVSVGVIWHGRGVTSLNDLQVQQITAGATGVIDDTGRFPTLIRKLTGAKIKVVTGYPGGNDVTMAMERGEVDARVGWSWGSLKSRSKNWIDEKKIHVLIQMALHKAPDLPDVPLIMDFAKSDLDKKALELLFSPQISAWPLIAPPDVPKERIAVLRRAFDATMKDPVFLADADKILIEVDPVSGEAMQQVVLRIATFDRFVIDCAIELTDPK